MSLSIRKGYDEEFLRQFDAANDTANAKMAVNVSLALIIINFPLLLLDIYRYLYTADIFSQFGYSEVFVVHICSCIVYPLLYIFGKIKMRNSDHDSNNGFCKYFWRIFFISAYLYALSTSAPCLAIYKNLTTLFVAVIVLAASFRIKQREYIAISVLLGVLDLFSLWFFVPGIKAVFAGIISDVISAVTVAICINYVFYKGSLESFFNKVNFQKEYAEKIEEQAASKAKTEFLANMSHEIRTPINGIRGMLALLHETELNGEQQEYVKHAESSCEVLGNIVNDLFEMTNINSGKILIENEPYSPEELIAASVATLSYQRHLKEIEIRTNIDKNVPGFVVGDRFRITQILNNLLTNAWKFTPEGTITVNCRLTEQENGVKMIRFEVIDTGIGIPDDKTNFLFERFAQLDSTIKKKFRGIGLGLAICKKLTGIMGGTISAKSNTPEAGSTFSFELPLIIPENNVENIKTD